jgi:hypothetical protein
VGPLDGTVGTDGVADAPLATGGVTSTGGVSGSGGSGLALDAAALSDDSPAAGGAIATGGAMATGGSPGTGGATWPGTTSGIDAALVTDGSSATGGTLASGGATGAGGVMGPDGASGTGGATGSGNCSFTIITNAISPMMATVGIVEWSTDLANPTSASIVYTLNNAAANVLNRGGTAPVDLTMESYRTLLLGLKPTSDYTFHIEAAAGSTTCRSPDYPLPRTGSYASPSVSTFSSHQSAQANGFIITSTGMGGRTAYIIDADGVVVWCATAPTSCSRARMDWEGINLWMLALNVGNAAGEMRYLSMDGMTGQTKVSGLSAAHHDFAVLPGKIAALAWASAGTDVESKLVEHASDGSGDATTVFEVGGNLYAGQLSGSGSPSYHSNSVLYHPADDSYTIGDRYPNLYVKVKHDGTPVWQIGGSCANAVAPKCAPGTWTLNHGHDFDANGNLLIFNNKGTWGFADVLEFKITETSSAISTSLVVDYPGDFTSAVLGDVQRLPNGNTLVTYSSAGQIVELDSSWNVVRSLGGTFGYADWRATLYGPPARR